jgi:MOSC domain-containing protein YiiM
VIARGDVRARRRKRQGHGREGSRHRGRTRAARLHRGGAAAGRGGGGAGRGGGGAGYFRTEAGGDPTEEVTLFSLDDLDDARREFDADIGPADLRRNLMTSGIDLDGLLGATFQVGDVVLEGLETNPPCAHLEQLAGKKLLKPLARRGGIRARIVSGGTIRSGDTIEASTTG